MSRAALGWLDWLLQVNLAFPAETERKAGPASASHLYDLRQVTVSLAYKLGVILITPTSGNCYDKLYTHSYTHAQRKLFIFSGSLKNTWIQIPVCQGLALPP